MNKSLQLMDAFYKKSKDALASDDYEIAQLWSSCESMVNNLHHGKDPSIWIPTLKTIINGWISNESREDLILAYREALEFIEIIE